MIVEIGTEAAQLPEKEYLNRIFVCSAAGVIDCHYRLHALADSTDQTDDSGLTRVLTHAFLA
jgi:hypothetical protein